MTAKGCTVMATDVDEYNDFSWFCDSGAPTWLASRLNETTLGQV
jgi:hypothetical protein